MKKKIALTLLMLTLTGCVRTDLKIENYDTLVLNVINNHSGYTNEVWNGYQFLIPKGVKLLENNSNNQIFLGFDTKIYVYVDISSYYYKNKLNYPISGDNYYYKEINNGDKSGYILIDKVDDLYFLKIVYNYAKVEAYVDEYNLNNVITLSTIIIDSIEYNDIVIEALLDDNRNNGNDITYTIDKPANADSDFSQYLEEYITENEADDNQIQLPDEELLERGVSDESIR